MSAIVRRQEITANNLANVNTTGYRKDRVFEEVLGSAIDVDGLPTTQRGLSTWIDQTQGSFEFTDRPLDVTIDGSGFFVTVDQQSGSPFYTRAGRFELDNAGTIVDSNGRTVMGHGGPISIPPNVESVSIGPGGDVKAGEAIVGRIRVVDFADDIDLVRVDGASFDARGAAETDVSDPNLKSGYVEQSNVNALTEMTAMIQDSRLFESQQRALRTLDQTLERAIRDLGQY